MNDTLDGRNAVELLAEEFLERKRNGERPSMNEYVDAYPALADEIREVFPAVALMENLRPESVDFDSEPAGPHPVESVNRETIGDYRVVREIGRGGMGIVFEAEQQSLGRRVAIKVLPRHSSGSSDSLERFRRFRREARAAARLHHTNIVPVFEVGQDDDTFYYAMQFIEGQGLDLVQQELSRLRDESQQPVRDSRPDRSDPHADTRLVKPGEQIHADTVNLVSDDTTNVSLPGRSQLSSVHNDEHNYFRSVARIGEQAASALEYAHNHGIIHRDIKPANLILDGDGVVWITDFGLARTDDESLTKTGDILGTLRYMSPERFNGHCDERADIYGVGMTLYELLSFRAAFDARDQLKLIDQIANREPIRPRQLNPTVPLDLETIVLKAIDKEPLRRYQSAKDLSADLSRFVNGDAVHARRVSISEKLVRWAGRNRAAAACLCSLTLLLCSWVFVATAAAAHYREREEEQRQIADQQGEIARQQGELAEQAEKEKDAAERVAEERRERLVRFNVARGARYMEAGDLLGSLPWFVEALSLDAGNTAREQLHRTRLAAVWARCPKPIHLWQYEFPPNHIEYSEDGRYLAVACGNRATVTDTITGETCFDLKHSWSPQIVRISSDGLVLLVVDAAKSVSLFDLKSGQRKCPAIEIDANVSCAAISPDGGLIAVGNNAGATMIIEVATGKAVGKPIVHRARVEDVTFSPNSRFVLTGSRDKTARVWLSRTGIPWGPPLQHTDVVTCVDYRPDKDRVLTASNDRTARLWGVTSGKQLAIMRHRSLVVDARFSPDSSKVVTASYDQTAQVWDADSGKAITPPLHHGHHVVSARFSPDSRRVVTASEDRTGCIWDAKTGERVAPPLRHADLLIGATFHPDGEHVATTTHSGMVRQWRIEGDDNMTPLQRHGSFVVDVDITSDGRRMATASQDKTARVWDVETGRPLTPSLPHHATVACVQFSPDGSRVVTAARDFTLRLWDAKTGQPLTPPLGPDGWVHFVRNEFQDRVRAVFSHDGRYVAGSFGSFTKRMGLAIVWDVESGEIVGAPMLHDGRIADVRFSPDDKRLATADLEKQARIWRVSDGEELLTLRHSGSVHSVRFSPDGRQLVTASGFRTIGEARVWDASTGEAVTPPMKHQGSVEVATFSPDGEKIATSSHDHTARIWDAKTGQPLTSPIRHGDQVRYVEFSPNGQYILTCGWGMYFDNVPLRGVRIWDATTGQPVTPLPIRHANTAIARFRQDSQAVAIAATRERGGKLWKLEADERPLEDLASLARLASGQAIDSTDAMAPVDVTDLISLHETLRLRYPREFLQGPDQRLAVLRRSLDRAIAARRWSLAKSYVEDLRTTGQSDEDLQRAANEIAWAILTGPNPDQFDNAELLDLARFGVPEASRAASTPVEWRPLAPIAIRSRNGAALSVLDDHTVLAAGKNPRSDSYIIVCDTKLEGITGLMLEARPDDSLPSTGPGRHVSGNFVISEFSVSAMARTGDGEPVPIELTKATAEFSQDGWPASAAIDGNDLTGWSVAPRRGTHHLVFAVKEALNHPGGSRLVIQIFSQDPTRFMHNLGRFRLMATTTPQPVGVEQFSVRQTPHRVGGWTTLALAQYRSGDAGAALQSLNMAEPTADNAGIHHLLIKSLVHWSLDNNKEALDLFQRADAWLIANTPDDSIRRLAVAALACRADSDPGNAEWLSRRSRLLFELGRGEEAIADLSRTIALDDTNVELLKQRGAWLARRGRWSQAADDYVKLSQLERYDHWHWYLALSLLYQAERIEDYRAMRTKALTSYWTTIDWHIAERIGKACLLDPEMSDEEVARTSRMTEEAVRLGKDDDSHKWFQAAAALSDYRNGRFHEALAHTAQSHRLAKSTDASLDALAYLIEAMCHHCEERPDAAERSLNLAMHILDHNTTSPKDGVLPSDWYNWVMCLILEKEARMTIARQKSEVQAIPR